MRGVSATAKLRPLTPIYRRRELRERVADMAKELEAIKQQLDAARTSYYALVKRTQEAQNELAKAEAVLRDYEKENKAAIERNAQQTVARLKRRLYAPSQR